MKLEQDKIVVLETNIDDMSPQVFDHVEDVFFAAGALDVFIEHIQMKKNRPAFKLSCIVTPDMTEKIASLILEETTSGGVRYYPMDRYKLPRKEEIRETSLGKIRIKIFELPSGQKRIMPEYEDCKKIAKKEKRPFNEVYRELLIKLENL